MDIFELMIFTPNELIAGYSLGLREKFLPLELLCTSKSHSLAEVDTPQR